MKKLFTTIACIATIAATNAQTIPNNSFENWSNVGTYSVPDMWGTMNNTTALANIYTATKASPGTDGSYYLMLTSKTISGVVVNGIAVSGQLDSTTLSPISGYAFTARPAALSGKWQHMIYGSSQGGISVKLTRWDAGTQTRITVAAGEVTLSGMAMSWASFSIPLTYTDGSYPDSCVIVMKASGDEPTNSDYLWIDNLAFTGSVAPTGINNITLPLHTVQVFPNPALDFIQVSINHNTHPIAIELFDIIGKKVMDKNTTDFENKLGTEQLKSGVYFLTVHTLEGSCTQKIIVQ